MPLDRERTRKLLQHFDLKTLFIEELGWDRCNSRPLEVLVEGRTFTLTPVTEKRGMVAFQCASHTGAKIPDYAVRRKIEKQTAKSVHEHLIIYTDADNTTQIWQWVKREVGKPIACREHTYYKTQPGDALVQKLQFLTFDLAEEEKGLTIVDVAGRARKAFDVDRVTKRFYDRFKQEHTAFRKFIHGIQQQGDLDWYASVMLNRLMFIYFIQKKGFMDGDQNYLSNSLKNSKRTNNFYHDFLVPLFFDGFAKEEKDRSEKIKNLLGKIPGIVKKV